MHENQQAKARATWPLPLRGRRWSVILALYEITCLAFTAS